MDAPYPVGDVWRLGFLGGLSLTLRESLLEGANLIDYPRGSATFRRQSVRRLAVVVSGLVRVYLSAPDGRQITLDYAGAGALLGAAAAPANDVLLAAMAVERSSLLHLDPIRVERLAMTHAELSWALTREIEERLSTAHRTVAISVFAPVRTRVARDLLARALARGSSDHRTPLRATHQDLADAVGSVREVAARAVRDLRKAGVVESHPDGVTIADLDRLRLEAELAG